MKVTEEYAACGIYAGCCQVGAIVDSGEIYAITEDRTDWQACVDTCPVNAIVD
jgi:electron transfer flavoprotein alpha subunit